MQGRKRLIKSIARLPEREQRIFELYFWRGLLPSEICEDLRLAQQRDIDLVEVFDALDHIFNHLSPKKLWRLISNQARLRRAVSLDASGEWAQGNFEPVDPGGNPEEMLLEKETQECRVRALAGLSPRERLVIQFRYEEGMAVEEIAEMLHWQEQEVKGLLQVAIEKLRRALK